MEKVVGFRGEHALIRVEELKREDLSTQEAYLSQMNACEYLRYIKPKPGSLLEEWRQVMDKTNATFNNRGRNTVLDCMIFGGNIEFWNNFKTYREIEEYFKRCYSFAVENIGYRETDENIVCSVRVTQGRMNNLRVYYLPLTNQWREKVLLAETDDHGRRKQKLNDFGIGERRLVCSVRPKLSHSDFWDVRGGKESYQELQKNFLEVVSKSYGAVRGDRKEAV